MGEDLNVLTREDAIKKNTTPTGRVLGVKMDMVFGLYSIGFTDNKAGDLPEHLKGRYTKGELARADLVRYLNDMWDMNDAVVEKSRLKAHREKVAEKETHAESQSASAG